MPITRHGYAARPRHGTTTARGYGAQHQRIRAALLPNAFGKPCPLCGQPMLATQRLELDHTVPLSNNPSSTGDRITHATCNRQRGQGT